MTLPRQMSVAIRSDEMVPAKNSRETPGGHGRMHHVNRKALEKEVASKLRQLEEQVKKTEAKLQSGEMDLDDLAE